MSNPRPFKERFWEKVEIGAGCWIWKGAKAGKGYGVFATRRNAMEYAHRLVYMVTKGDIKPGYDVCHSCDNPACCNPDHLFQGTRQDNMNDAKQKGRTAIGERVGGSILTAEQVKEIKRRAGAGENQHLLAKEFGVRNTTISAIHVGDNWTHV